MFTNCTLLDELVASRCACSDVPYKLNPIHARFRFMFSSSSLFPIKTTHAPTQIQTMVRKSQAKVYLIALKDSRLRSFIRMATRIQTFGRRFMAQNQLELYREARQQRTKAAAKTIGQIHRDLNVRETMMTLNRERSAAAQQRASENRVYVVVSWMENWLVKLVVLMAFSTALSWGMPKMNQVLQDPSSIFQPSTLFNTSTDFPKTKTFPSFPLFDASPQQGRSILGVSTNNNNGNNNSNNNNRRKNRNERRNKKKKKTKKPEEDSGFGLFRLFDPDTNEKSRVIEPYYFNA